jgi:hypothetical protein
MFPLLLALDLTNGYVYICENSDSKPEIFIFTCHVACSIDIDTRLLGLKHHNITLYTRYFHRTTTLTPGK